MRSTARIVPLFVIIAGCSGPPETPSVPAPVASVSVTVTHPQRKLPDQAAVTRSLLTPAELGTEFVANPGLATNNPANGLNTSLTDCAEASEDTGAVTAQQVYQGGPLGPFVVETLTATQVDQAATLMAQLRRVKENCHQFDGQMAGGITLNVTIDDLSVAAMGDEVVAYRLTATVPNAGAAMYAHMATVRSGGLVVLVSLMQMTSPDVAGTENALRKALAKAQSLG